jgi:hypothetical protein
MKKPYDVRFKSRTTIAQQQSDVRKEVPEEILEKHKRLQLRFHRLRIDDKPTDKEFPYA